MPCHVVAVVQLLTSWRDIFTAIQNAAAEQPADSNAEFTDFLLLQSKAYRAALESYLITVNDKFINNDTELLSQLKHRSITKDTYHSTLLLLEISKSMFHLFEIMYVDSNANITAQLLDWLQRSVPVPVVEESYTVDSDEWWNILIRLTLQGRIVEVLSMLQENEIFNSMYGGSSESGLPTQLNILLSTIPSIVTRTQGVSATTPHDVTAFLKMMEAWKASARKLRGNRKQTPNHTFQMAACVHYIVMNRILFSFFSRVYIM